jgi:LuxR family maltose regulon positive regulatory protein
MGKESLPLLKTKLHIPPHRGHVILRSRLIGNLENALQQQHRLILISAQAGSGKTTLACEWLHSQQRPSVWLSLDSKDNDPRIFISYLMEALKQLDIVISQEVLSQFENTQLPDADVIMTRVINEIASNADSFLFVLDDYHVIQTSWIHQAVEFLVQNQPARMYLIITTRVEPPLSLAQLRVRHQLTEIKDPDLRFTTAEVVEFLNGRMGLELSPQAIATIERRTEGWVAGLQMAAISAQGHKRGGDLDAFINAFGGTNRFLLDYLMEEVLNQQPRNIQDFLIETSVLDRMCGELCDTVRLEPVERSGSQAMLVQLERTNLFVIPLDDERHWYRYHHLFADLLQSILRQRYSTEQIYELHRRASLWYQKAGDLSEAMSHSLAAQDFERAASIIDENIMGLVDVSFRSRGPLLLDWIAKLPDEVKRDRPWLNVYRANLLALSLQLDQVEPILDDVEIRIAESSYRSPELLGHIAAVRAYVANLRGDTGRAIALANLVKTYVPGEENLIARATAAYALEDTYFATDDMESASQALLDLLKIGEQAEQLMIIVPALSDLAAINKVQGNLYQAERLYAKAYRWLVKRHGLDTRVRCSYEFGMADLLREWNQLDAAYEHAMIGMDVRKRQGGYNIIGDLALMGVAQARGDTEGAMRALHASEQALKVYPFQLALMIEFKTARVKQWLAVGEIDLASHWAKECYGGSELEQIVLARLHLAQGRAREAQKILSPQSALAQTAGRTGRLIEILALQAVAFSMQGLMDKAETALSEVISIAQPEGYQRIFLDLGTPLYEILVRSSQGKSAIDGYRQTLLDTFSQESRIRSNNPFGGLIDLLSARELEVLRLLAEGFSNKDIASKLIVAPSTIKQHLKNIFRKLDAHGRMEAVRRGRELKLL